MHNLINNKKISTIIIISHRIETLKICDLLYRVSNGSVVFFVIAVGWLATRFTVSTTLLFMGALGIFISLLFLGSEKIRNLKNEI